MYIRISVNNKIATLQDNVLIINGNSDYVIKFDFDAEWDAYETKTARFVTARGYTDVVFSGDEVALPVITDAISVRVGVYAGNLRTTTPAVIFCRRCITDGSGSPADPAPDVYAQIMERLNNLDGATPATADKLGVVKIGDNLKITEDGVLSVDTAVAVEQDNTKPVTSATVYTAKSNIEALLGNLSGLETEAKDNLVVAVNEVKHTTDGKQDKLIAGENITIAADGKTISATGGGGGGGTTDYTALSNKPQINGVELSDNKTSADLGIGNPTDAQVASAVEAWLYAHPEATTTVADKSITTEKLDDGSVILSKLSESVTNEHYFDPYLRVQYTVGMINADGTIDTSKNYYVTEYLPVIPGETIWLTGGLTKATAYYDKDKNFVSKQTISAGLNPYVVPNGAHYAIYQNIYTGGNVSFFPVRKKGTPKNECFSDLIFSPIKSEVSVGVTGDSNTLGYGLSAGELSWAELLMAEVEKTTSIRVLYHSRFAESFGACLYGGGLNYKTGSQFSVWTDAAHIDLSFSANYDSVFSWYSNDVEIAGSSGLTSMDLNGEFSKITVKFASGQAVNPVFTIPKTITHTNAAVTGVGAQNVTIPEGHDWLLLMVGTNDRNMLAKDFLGNKAYRYSGKGTYVVPFPNHKEESTNIITQAHRFNEYRNLMRDCGYEVIDCSDVNSWAFYDDTLYQTDRIHFNAKGHRIMCNMISGKMGMPVMLKEN